MKNLSGEKKKKYLKILELVLKYFKLSERIIFITSLRKDDNILLGELLGEAQNALNNKYAKLQTELSSRLYEEQQNIIDEIVKLLNTFEPETRKEIVSEIENRIKRNIEPHKRLYESCKKKLEDLIKTASIYLERGLKVPLELVAKINSLSVQCKRAYLTISIYEYLRRELSDVWNNNRNMII